MVKDLSIRKGGRPPKKASEKRTRNVVFRLTDEEYNEFRKLYLESGKLTVRKFLMDSYLNRKGIKTGPSLDAEIFTLLRTNVKDIHAVGVNVNQIAAKINSMKGDISDQVLGYEVKKMLVSLSEISPMEETVVKAAECIIESFFAK